MKAALLAGVFLTAAVAAAHSYLGERYILRRLFRRPNLPHLFGSDAFTKQVLRFAWHLTSIAWLGLAAIMLALAYAQGLSLASAVARAIAVTFLVSAILTGVSTRGRHLAWIVFLAIAVSAWIAG